MPGKETRFTFHVPCIELTSVPEESAPAPEAAIQAVSLLSNSDAPRGKQRMLLADDSALNRQLVKIMLGSDNYHVDEVEDGEQAWEALQREHYDLVLMDCMMPGMAGQEVTRRMRDWERTAGTERTPVIALTAGVTADERERCLEAGMDAVLSKPFGRTELGAVINNTLLRKAISE